ncbi:MAG: NUDIX domain-containing protein, partial [Acidimicrobiia bacterium]
MGTYERSGPTPAATVILAIPGLTGFEVLMVRRPPGGIFGGIWVFPGGVVDTSDRESPSDLSDRAHRRAAVRELVEETGIALDISGLA